VIASMTGFARAQGEYGDSSWIWEVKSVNSRGLDIRMRLPSGNDDVEVAARAAIGQVFKRGSISASLNLQRNGGEASLQVNRAFLRQLIDIAREMGHETPHIESLFGVRGVVEPQETALDEEAEAARRKAYQETFEQALKALHAARGDEGRKLLVLLEARLAEIEALIVAAEAAANARQDTAKDRLAAQVAALLEATNVVPEERLAQELALIAVKGDVLEELDRLKAHVAQARELIGEGEAIGRRLDFLCQEFNREANTLCSKSNDVAMTRIGLDLKAVIDQLREQVQNVE
jgi:uncharacterized protein (TIGR00255 family)